MNPRIPLWAQELQSHVEAIPYGDIRLQIKRIDHKTVQVVTEAQETLRYVDNQEATKDLLRLIENLVESKFSGEVHLQLQMRDGNIQLLGIFDKKQTKY